MSALSRPASAAKSCRHLKAGEAKAMRSPPRAGDFQIGKVCARPSVFWPLLGPVRFPFPKARRAELFCSGGLVSAPLQPAVNRAAEDRCLALGGLKHPREAVLFLLP